MNDYSTINRRIIRRRNRRNRDKVTIIMQILEYLACGCSKPSKASLALNITYDRLIHLLKSLEDAGLVKNSINGYCITQSGLMLLEGYRRFMNTLKALNIMV
ncbi:winged helix-turn-helix domain-containing protein [Caldivirga sp. UBA161]|uniref:winged helix-turn-helix domain-containing protein n=1 Tax=Caldivirga sp. UBA161 TaxID=1915569 RepID=UPI0025C127F2|nr:winged helix-turn-helix domain-containing protein [Caldivirga sp. UBA161]